MKLGLALSGAGFRATVFHLGTLARLAESALLTDLTPMAILQYALADCQIRR